MQRQPTADIGNPSYTSGFARDDRVTSVLVYDDRADVRREFAETLRRTDPTAQPVHIECVPDNVALLDAFTARPADLVMVGVHSGNATGGAAVRLLLDVHPAARTIIFGSIADIELLAATYACGAGGLLLWEMEKNTPPRNLPCTAIQGGTAKRSREITRATRSSAPLLGGNDLTIRHGKRMDVLAAQCIRRPADFRRSKRMVVRSKPH